MTTHIHFQLILPLLLISMTSWAVVTSCSTTTKSGTCKSGWFGSRCQYKCRCEHNACISRYNGSCQTGYKCQGGWFGPECQYVDLAYNTTNLITDGIDSTCLTQYTLSVTVPLNNTVFNGLYYFTWMRVLISEPWSERFLFNLKVEGLNQNGSFPCTRSRNFTVDNKILDVYCEIPQRITSVKLYGQAVSCLCSVHVSGGRNVALGQATSQTGSSTNPRLKQECPSEDCYKSSCAVDGDTSDVTRDSCIYTELDGEQPIWIINFTTSIIPNRCTIYNFYQSNSAPEALQNFTMEDFNEQNSRVYLGNLTKNRKYRSYSMYHSMLNNILSSMVLKPHLSQNRKYNMSFCELEVYGEYSCLKGRYGKECQDRCNCAENSECFASTGICSAGCADGYQGNTCNQACPRNTYGRNCLQNCSQFCYGLSYSISVCDRYNGSCIRGCQSGYEGVQCLKNCGKDKYGRGCTSQCSVNCVRRTPTTSSCNRTTGQCFDGCQDGYLGDKCDRACDYNLYGPGCISTCSQYCQSESYFPDCNNTNGYCLHGCQDGYKGEKCDKACDRGFYGKNCISPCSKNCLDRSFATSTCDHISGHCVAGCKDGFIGDMCDRACDPGFYGPSCKFECNHNCRLMTGQTVTCNNTNGHCLIGCQDGWQGARCQYGCGTGKYGRDCSLSCSDFCVAANNEDGSSCNHVTGNCLHGCLPGYLGPHCVVKLTANKEDYTSTITVTIGVLGVAIILLFVLLGITYRKSKLSGSSTNTAIAMKNLHTTKVYTKKVNATAGNYKEQDEENLEFESDDADNQTAVENVYSNCGNN